jgi:hypothetical protein
MSRLSSNMRRYRPRMPGTTRARRLALVLSLLTVSALALAVSACGQQGSGGITTVVVTATATLTPTATATLAPTATPVPFRVTSIDLTVSPASIAGTSCGTTVTLTYYATFHIPDATHGGTIHFGYTTNNGRSQTSATVGVAPGQTTANYTFSTSGTLAADHTFPGVAIVMVTDPNTVRSSSVIPSGSCS